MTVFIHSVLCDSRLTSHSLLIVLCNMAGYLSDFDDVDDNFEYDGRPYRSE